MTNTVRNLNHINVFTVDELCVDDNGVINWIDNGPCSFLSHEIVGKTVDNLEQAVVRWNARNIDKFTCSPKKAFRRQCNRSNRRHAKTLIVNALYSGHEDDVSVNDMEYPLPYWD